MRIQKILAQAGFGSRRQLEAWIKEGRIKVNGKISVLGDRLQDKDRLELDGRRIKNPLSYETSKKTIIYHKPEGEICTRNDPEQRKTIFEGLPKLRGSRWVSVGRLDINTSGLLLLTNDGGLANHLMHPSRGFEREYAVRILGDVDGEVLHRLQQGVELEDGSARFSSIRDAGGTGANHWYHVVVSEGRNRLVRRLWESQGVRVSRLIRIRFGPFSLPSRLRTGRWLELDEAELQQLDKVR